MKNRNLAMLTDLYELTMMQGYFKQKSKEIVVFDMFYRKNPSGSGFSIACGLEQVIEYIKNCFPKNLYAIISKAVSIIRFATESSILNKFFKSNKSPNTPPSVILF